MKLVTTNCYNRQLFRLLPPDWSESLKSWSDWWMVYTYEKYRWRFGKNPPCDQWTRQLSIGDIIYACRKLDRKTNINIHQYTLCWVGAPKNHISDAHINIYTSQAIIYRAMTVDELRKTDDTMYRVVIACAIMSGPTTMRNVSLVTELDCICYVMSIVAETDLIHIPKYARTVIVQFFARIMFPNNTAFQTDTDAVNKLMNSMLFDHPRIQLSNYFNRLHVPDLVDNPANQIIVDLQEYLKDYMYNH